MKYSPLPVLLSLSLSLCLHSQVPRYVSYQGMLTQSDGQPVPAGDYALTFRLYDVNSTEIWSESHTNVPVSRGLFQVELGRQAPLEQPFDSPYFLGVQVGTEPEMQPRMALTSAP
jgi:hypothetical protein